ncbi:MAG TPA: ImmA/IrrE family metallo-endopeptidase [Steroidobacteraceae bacterium]|nr:ImmA/IrrE family metallo-endopeptidase [Steroidobacteraceae bacterium]
MTAISRHIRSLESYIERCGGRVVRAALPDAVYGGVSKDLITLHADLDPQQQLLTLVHELTHWLAHRDGAPGSGARRTIYEYEAEAVESLVMVRLGLPIPPQGSAAGEPQGATDDLLTSSVARVLSTTQRIYQALGI